MDITNNISTRKLNNCGIISGHCTVINSEEGMKHANYDICVTVTMDSIKTKKEQIQRSSKINRVCDIVHQKRLKSV